MQFLSRFLGVFLGLMAISLGQNPYIKLSIDSLKVLENEVAQDSQKVFIKSALFKKLSRSDPREALSYAQSTFDLATVAGMTFEGTEALIAQGSMYQKLGDKSRALQLFSESEAISRAEGFHLLLGNSYYKRGVMHFYYGEHDSSLYYHQQAYALYKEHGNDRLLAHSHNALGILYDPEPEKQVYHYGKAIELAQKMGDVGLQASTTINLANIYRTKKGDLRKALEKLEEAAILFDSAESRRGLASAYINIAAIYTVWEEHGKALKYHQQAYALRDSMGDQNGLMECCSQIADLYLNMEDFEKALDYCRRSEVLGLELGNKMLLGYNYTIMGEVYKQLGTVDSARFFAKKGIDLLSEIDGGERFTGTSYWTLGEIENLAGNKGEALNYMNRALEIAEETNDTRKAGRYSGSIAALFLSMSKSERTELGISTYAIEKMLMNALEVANNAKEYDFQHQVYTSAIQLFKETNSRPELIMAFQDSLLQIKDSLFNENKTASLGEWATRLETFEKDKEIELLEKQKQIDSQEKALLNARNRQYLLVGIGLLLLLVIGSAFYVQLRKNKQQIETQKEELVQLNQTRDTFFSMIAHDLRSPASALEGVGEQMDYYLAKNNQEKLSRLGERTGRTAKKLTGLLDNLLNWALAQKGSIPYKPQALNIYQASEDSIELYRELALAKEITISNNTAADIQVFADERAVTTILRNLINNAVKFTKPKGAITIDASENEDFVEIIVHDTGSGMTEEQIQGLFSLNKKAARGTAGEQGTGLGLALCKELAEINKGSILVQSAPHEGSTFFIRLPLVR